MLDKRFWLVCSILALPLQCILGLVAQSSNSIAQSSQPRLSATSSIPPNGTYTDLSEDAPLAFKVEYRYKAGGTTFDRIAFLNTMLGGISAMTWWPWNSRSTGAVLLPSPYGVSMRFIPARSGPGLMTKHIAWTIEEIFDIVVENDRYSVGNFLVNSNWDEDRLAIGSLSVTAPTLALGSTTDVKSNDRPEPTSRTMPVIQIPDGWTSNTQLSAANQSSYLEAASEVSTRITFPRGGAVFQDVQVYNATIKVLIKVAAATGSIWPMVATYNDMDDFTLSVRSISVALGSELTWAEAARTLAWFPQDGLRWRELSGVILVDNKPKGIICIDKGDRTNFFSSTRCEPDLADKPEDGAAITRL